MKTIFRGGIIESNKSLQQRPRTAMDCITNTHISSLNRAARGTIDKKRGSSATVQPPFKTTLMIRDEFISEDDNL